MRKEFAEKMLEFVKNDCKKNLEKSIKEVLGVKVDLVFNVGHAGSIGYYIKVVDACHDVDKKMRSNPMLQQLFSSAELRVDVFPNDENEEIGVYFNVGVSYKHTFRGGSNGHDLIGVCVDEKGEVVRILK